MSTQGDAKLAVANLAAAEEKYSRCKSRIDSAKQQLANWVDPTDKSGAAQPVAAAQARYAVEKGLLTNEAVLLGFAIELVSCRMAARVPGYGPVELMAAVDFYRAYDLDEVKEAVEFYRKRGEWRDSIEELAREACRHE